MVLPGRMPHSTSTGRGGKSTNVCRITSGGSELRPGDERSRDRGCWVMGQRFGSRAVVGRALGGGRLGHPRIAAGVIGAVALAAGLTACASVAGTPSATGLT